MNENNECRREVEIDGITYTSSFERVPLLYSLTDVDNADFRLRSSFRSVRNCSHISAKDKHLVSIISPELGKGIVCYRRGNFFITEPTDSMDGLKTVNITDKVLAVADLI